MPKAMIATLQENLKHLLLGCFRRSERNVKGVERTLARPVLAILNEPSSTVSQGGLFEERLGLRISVAKGFRLHIRGLAKDHGILKDLSMHVGTPCQSNPAHVVMPFNILP